MLVALGSKRGPKLRALEAVLGELGRELGCAEIRAHDPRSGVRETPLDRAETMRGAGISYSCSQLTRARRFATPAV